MEISSIFSFSPRSIPLPVMNADVSEGDMLADSLKYVRLMACSVESIAAREKMTPTGIEPVLRRRERAVS